MLPVDPITQHVRMVNALRCLNRFADAASRALDTGSIETLRDALDAYENSDSARLVLETLYPAEHAA